MSDNLCADDLPNEFDVAVVVIGKARGTGSSDAADRLVQAVSRLLHDSKPIPLPHRAGNVAGAYVEIYDVMEAGMALGNGYLWTAPTSKARR